MYAFKEGISNVILHQTETILRQLQFTDHLSSVKEVRASTKDRVGWWFESRQGHTLDLIIGLLVAASSAARIKRTVLEQFCPGFSVL